MGDLHDDLKLLREEDDHGLGPGGLYTIEDDLKVIMIGRKRMI